jgi:FkbM family methyltransferase
MSFRWLLARMAMRLVPWLPTEVLRWVARLVARPRSLGRMPGWRFAIEEELATPLISLRRRLWDHFRDRAVERPVRMRWLDGLQLDLVLGNDQSRCLFVGGSFEPNELAFVAGFLKPGMVAVDAGANEGLYSLLMARRVGAEGQVVAVEPSPRERRRLERNVALNGLGNVRVVASGLGAAAGRGVLHVAEAEHSGQNTLGGFVYAGLREAGSVEIDLQTLDTVTQSHCARPVDFIKMDVEGAEMAVLRGASRVLDTQPVLLFELLDPSLRAQGSSAQEVIDFLAARQFSVLAFAHDGRLLPLRRLSEASSNLVGVPPGRMEEVLAAARQ